MAIKTSYSHTLYCRIEIICTVEQNEKIWFQYGKMVLTSYFLFDFYFLSFMAKRITVMIDDDLHDKLRKLQAKMIQESGKSVSFSRVINEKLAKTAKN